MDDPFTPQTYVDNGAALTALEARINAGFDVVKAAIEAIPAPAASKTQAVRVPCVALAANANYDIVVTWPTAFADTNYTFVVTLEDAESNPLAISDGSLVRHTLVKTAQGVKVRVGVGPTNVPAGGFVVHAVAVHD